MDIEPFLERQGDRGYEDVLLGFKPGQGLSSIDKPFGADARSGCGQLDRLIG